MVLPLYCVCRLLDILEVIAPYKHFHKLRQFVDMKLPSGFPVKLGKKSRLQLYTDLCAHTIRRSGYCMLSMSLPS